MYAARTTLASDQGSNLASDQGSKTASWALSPKALELTIRVGAFLCFVGHGAFGIMTKRAWLPYFAVANIGPDTAHHLMPIIGALDISMGLLVLLAPRPAVVYWMVAWAVWTALLRPLAGESAWETIERAGNYGVPAAMLLLMSRPRGVLDAFASVRFQTLSPDILSRARRWLTIVTAALLIGHGALGVESKQGLIDNYAAVVPVSLAAAVTPILGWFEIALAVVLMRRQTVTLALFVAAWKLATESLFVVAGQSPFEIVERGGSYAAPLALAVALILLADRSRE